MWVKFLLCVFMGFAVPVLSEVSGFHESKFVGIIFFGWACFYNWGHDKPEKPLAILWMGFQPFLFSSVGAAIQFKDIDPSMLGSAIVIILIGVTFRWVGTRLAHACEELGERILTWRLACSSLFLVLLFCNIFEVFKHVA